MSMTTITIQVDPKSADVFENSSPEEKMKMQLLLNLRLQELTASQTKPLKILMDEIGARAEERGLTPEILESLLNDSE